MKGKIAITGAAGFLGANAVNFFANNGLSVTACVRPNTKKRFLKRLYGDNFSRIRMKEVDLISASDAKQAIKNQDYIINFAALDGNSEFKNHHSAEMFSINMRITLNLLEALTENSKAKFVHISTSDIYTDSKSEVLNEESEIQVNWKVPYDGYKLSKWCAELVAREFARQYKLKIIIVRPGNIYGPGEKISDRPRLRFISSGIIGAMEKKTITLWGDGKQVRSFLFVEDFLRICEKLIDKNHYNDPINIASKQHYTLLQIAKKIKKEIGGDVSIALDKSKFAGASKRVFSLKKLEKIVGPYEETPIEEGIKKTSDYMKHLLDVK